MIEVAKTYYSTMAHHLSSQHFSLDLKKYGIVAKLIPVGRPSYPSIVDFYSREDFDILFLEDRDSASDLLRLYYPIFGVVPIIFFQHTSHSCIPRQHKGISGDLFRMSEFANFVAAAEVWLGSKSHRDIILNSAGHLFTEDFLRMIERKIRIIALGLDMDEICPPQVVDPIRVIFPYRMNADKGLPEFLRYAVLLQAKDPTAEFFVRNDSKRFCEEFRRAIRNVTFFSPLPREEFFNLARRCNVIFSAANLETFGLAVLECVACGAYPILPDRLSYSEIFASHPEILYKDIDEAVEMTLAARGKIFDNSFVSKYLWKNLAGYWQSALEDAYYEFYSPFSKSMTAATEKLLKLSQKLGWDKKALKREMGWVSDKGWGIYRYKLRCAGIDSFPAPVCCDSSLRDTKASRARSGSREISLF